MVVVVVMVVVMVVVLVVVVVVVALTISWLMSFLSPRSQGKERLTITTFDGAGGMWVEGG